MRASAASRTLAETLESAPSGKDSPRDIRGIELEGFGPGGGNLLLRRSISLAIVSVGPNWNTTSIILTSARWNLKAHGWRRSWISH